MQEKLNQVAENILYGFLGARKNSKIFLINDHEPNSVYDSFKNALLKRNVPYSEAKLSEERKNSEPIPQLREQMIKSKIIIAPTKRSITHCPETKKAEEKGAKIITLPGVTEEIFLKVGEADLKWIWKENNKIAKQLRGKNKVQITTPNGTNISFSIKKRELHGLKPKKKGFVMNLPTGEVYLAPIEETADGEIIIDYFEDKIKPEQKAWIKVEMGKIGEWNQEAVPFIELQQVENGFVIAEMGIGTNKWHTKPIGNILHDEKLFGTCHLAFGNNVSFGGKNKSSVHNDIILINPTILIDGKKLEW